MTEKQLQALCQLWQKRLRLLDWSVSCEFRQYHLMPGSSDEYTIGFIQPCEHTKTAKLVVLSPEDRWIAEHAAGEYIIEEIVVHELIHLHALTFEPEREGAAHANFEFMINCLAKALVSAYDDRD